MFFFFFSGQPFQVECLKGDVLDTPADLLILKYANGFHGADLAVAKALGLKQLDLKSGEYQFVQTDQKIRAQEVLFLGVGRLGAFDYAPISAFASKAMEIARRERPAAKLLGITLHGPGYGLDELASIDSLIAGLQQVELATPAAGQTLPTPNPKTVLIIERSERRVARIAEYLAAGSTTPRSSESPDTEIFSPEAAKAISSSGTYERRLFAAMPFGRDYLDHWDLVFQPAAHENKLVIERLDHEVFTGDIVSEIRNRIEKSAAVVALLDENNPNVFLEVGYAWGVKKPAILMLKDGQDAPFDVRSQRLIRYGRLGELRNSLTKELKGLLASAAI